MTSDKNQGCNTVTKMTVEDKDSAKQSCNETKQRIRPKRHSNICVFG